VREVEPDNLPQELFDRAAEYEAMLNQGSGLSGENEDNFIVGRIQDLQGAAAV